MVGHAALLLSYTVVDMPSSSVAPSAPSERVRVPLGVLLLGLAYAAFSVALAIGRAAPKRALLPIPLEHYYAVQAGFVAPLFAVLTALHTAVVRHVATERARAHRAFGDSWVVLGNAYAWPLLALFVVPDALVFSLFGFDALAPAMRWYGPAAMVGVLVLSTLRAREHLSMSGGRAFGAALLGLVVQALVGGLFLR